MFLWKKMINTHQKKQNFKEIFKIGSGHITDIITSVDREELVESGEKVLKIFEGKLFRVNFEFNLLR